METPHLSLVQTPEGACRSLRIVDNTLDDANLESRCPLDEGRYTPRATGSTGLLDWLPLELVTAIFLALDLQSLTTFRQVSSYAMNLVDSLHQYAMVRQHCPSVLRAIVSIGAVSFTCETLYKTLCTSKCANCDRFGSYIYLITCERVCYFCFTSSAPYLPVTAWEATREMKIKKKKLQYLPNVSSLPGRYTESGRVSRKRTLLFDRLSVLELAQESSELAAEGTIQQHRNRRTREPRRYMSIISAPYLDPSGRSADWGFYCTGCVDSKDSATHFRNKFTRDGMADHIAYYGEITTVNRKGRMTHARILPQI